MKPLQIEIQVERVNNGYLGMIFRVNNPRKGVANNGADAITGTDAEEFIDNLSAALFAELVKNS